MKYISYLIKKEVWYFSGPAHVQLNDHFSAYDAKQRPALLLKLAIRKGFFPPFSRILFWNTGNFWALIAELHRWFTCIEEFILWLIETLLYSNNNKILFIKQLTLQTVLK